MGTPQVSFNLLVFPSVCLSFPLSLFFFFFVFLSFVVAVAVVAVAISWAAPAAYGGSQARGQIRAVAVSLRQNRSNLGSESCLQSTPQLMATPDP